MGLWDMRRAIEHTVLGSSKLVGPFDGFGTGSNLNGVASSGSSGAGTGATAGLTGGGAAVANANASASAAAGAGAVSGSGAAAAAVSTGGSGFGGIAGYGLHNGRLLHSQPSMIHFFTSPYFLLLCFMVGRRFWYFVFFLFSSLSFFRGPGVTKRQLMHAKCTHVKPLTNLTIAVFFFFSRMDIEHCTEQD